MDVLCQILLMDLMLSDELENSFLKENNEKSHLSMALFVVITEVLICSTPNQLYDLF
jgi:hypothetical protein